MLDSQTEVRHKEASSHPAPVRIGTAKEIAVVLRTLRDAAFDEKTICETFGLGDMSDVGHLTIADIERAEASQQLKVLACLFLVLTLVPRSEVERILGESAIDSFRSLGLLGHGDFGDNFYATVLLAPVDSFFVVSDRLINPDGSPLVERPDVVFPAIYPGTLQFLRLVPANEGADALDLCAGTGIAAFSLSRTNRRAFSVDITSRASDFARFNKALNGCGNVKILQGDLYAPLTGQTFDCIVAHPPHVPSLSFDTIWRDGGLIGDVLIKRIVEELPKYLRTHGYALILAQGADTEEGKFEERVRQWLSESAHEFDIIFAGEKDRSPGKVLEFLGRKTAADVIGQLRDAFEAAGVQNMPYGALFLRRIQRSPDRPPWTIRAKLSSETTGADFQSTFALHDVVSRPEFAAHLPQTNPMLAPHLEVMVTYVVDEGSLVPGEYIFATSRPFAKRVRFDDWTIPLFMRFDGKTTVAQIYEAAKTGSEVPEEFGIDDFVLLVTRSIEAGFLILPRAHCEVSWSV
jgi:SAM-dependent methyltransferase